MNGIERDLWSRLNVLAETDALAARIVTYDRMRVQPTTEVLLQGILAYAEIANVLRRRLLDAEGMRPRVFYLPASPA